MNHIVLSNRFKFLFGAITFLFAMLPRLIAAQGDLWLDEIWSLNLIKNAEHFWDILRINHDNNHILNSFYLFVVGENGSVFSYRLLSVLIGSAVVVTMGLINLQWGLAAGLLTAGLGAFSYPLIHYSSEARGYALAMFFALTSYVSIKQIVAKRSKWSIVIFQTSVALGMLSHLMFIFVYVSLLAWVMANQIRSGSSLKQLAARMAFWNLIPASVTLLLYLFFFRKMLVGGGDPRSYAEVLASLAILISGALEFQLTEYMGIVLSCIGLTVSLLYLQRESDDEDLFYLSVIILVPLIFWIFVRPGFLSERYFLIGLPFYYIMTGRFLALSLCRSVSGKISCILVFLFFLGGNSQRTIDLATFGRGGYRQAVDFMAGQTSGSDIRVGSDHDFRNKMLLEYYSRYLPLEKHLLYFEKNRWPADGPDWIITHSQKVDFNPPTMIETQGNVKYFLQNWYKYKGLSGFHWALYRQQSQMTN